MRQEHDQSQVSEKENQFAYILNSQKEWRALRRGWISRPRELPFVSHALDASMKKVFAGYIPQNRPESLVVWSIFQDRPLDARAFHSSIRTPLEVSPKDTHAYLLGIYQLNEWATDFATKHWFASIGRSAVLRQFQAFYGEVMGGQMRLNYGKTAWFMDMVAHAAEENGLNFRHAVFTALFQHNFTLLNHCIAQTGIGGCGTIDQAALYIGKRLAKHNITDIALALSNESGTQWKNAVKRTLLSTITAGMHEEPGIVYIHLAPSVFESVTLGFLATGLSGDIFSGIGSGLLVGSAVNAVLFYVLIHETIHEYAAGRRYRGLMPITLSSKV